MADLIKTKGGIGRDDFPTESYDSLFGDVPASQVTQTGLDFKQANVERIAPEKGDVTVDSVKFETVPGGRPVAIRGPIGPSLVGTAGEDMLKGYMVMLLLDGKFYLLDSATSIAEKYRGVLLEDVKEGDIARVQTIGDAETYRTNLTISEDYYGQDGTVDVSVTPNTTGSSLSVFGFDSVNWQEVHQRFTVSADMRRVTTIELQQRRVNGSASGVDIELGIYELDGSGNPTGSAVWSVTYDSLTISTTSTAYNYTVDAALDPSTQYTIYMKTATRSYGTFQGILLEQVSNSATPVARRDNSSFGGWTDDTVASNFKIRRGSGTIETTVGTYTKKVGAAFTKSKIDIIKN